MPNPENKPLQEESNQSHSIPNEEDDLEAEAYEDELVKDSKKTLRSEEHQRHRWSMAVSALLKLLAIFFLFLAISLPALDGQSLFVDLFSSDRGLRSYGRWTVITNFVAVALLAVSLAQLFFRKQRRFSVYFSGFGLVVSLLGTLLAVAFNGAYQNTSSGPVVVMAFVLIFVFADVVLLSFLPKVKQEDDSLTKEKEFRVLRITEIVLVLFGLACLLSTFFLRFYYFKNNEDGPATSYRMIDALNQKCDLIIVLLSFTGFFAVTLLELILLVQNIRNFFSAPRKFLKRNRLCLYLDLIGTGAFALLTFILTRFVTPTLVTDGSMTITAMIPFFLVGVALIVESALSARYAEPVVEEKEEKKAARTYTGHLTSLLFLLAMGVVAFDAFFGRIITIKGTYNGAQFYPTDGGDGAVIGWEVLEEYVFPNTRGSAQEGSLLSGTGFSILALVLFVFSISDILFLLFSLICFFSRSKTFVRLSMVGVIALYIEIFGIWAFGLDYAIASDTNKETIAAYLMSSHFNSLSALGISRSQLASEATAYNISTVSGTMIYFLIATVLGVLCIIFHPFTKQLSLEELPVNIASADAFDDKDPFAPAPIESKEEDEKENDNDEEAWACAKCGMVNHGKYCENCGAPGPFVPKEEEPKSVTFEPCPAFALIDEEEQERKETLAKRQAEAFQNPTLPEVTRFVVDYARDSRLHLSYTPEIIASFIAGLGATKLTILQGMSGTGKTSLPKIFAEALDCDCRLVEVESSWKDKNELIGYYNEFTKLFTPKKFTTALYSATLEKETINFIVLDEMNLSRIEYYFSDFLSLMEAEPDKRVFSLSSVPLFRQEDGTRKDYLGLTKGTTIRVTPNLWFIGTANRDESTFEISDKVYDRSNVINLNHRAPKAIPQGQPRSPKYLSYAALQGLFDTALSSFAFDLDTVPYLSKLEEILAPYNISFGNRIARQIEAYVRIYCSCFIDKEAHLNEALESILLDKVVHKLEYKSIEDKESLAEAFEAIGLKRCASFVRSLSEDL